MRSRLPFRWSRGWCAAGLVLLVAGCEHGGEDVAQSFGVLRDSPVEFQVTTRQPLEIPPTYDLAPPDPHAESASQKSIRAQAEAVLAPTMALYRPPDQPSPGEKALLAAAGPPPPPGIRETVDQETNAMVQGRRLSALLFFWKPQRSPAELLDAEAEAKRLAAAREAGKSPAEGPIPLLRPEQKSGLFEGLF
jgi:hypothetical protein